MVRPGRPLVTSAALGALGGPQKGISHGFQLPLLLPGLAWAGAGWPFGVHLPRPLSNRAKKTETRGASKSNH